MVHERIGLNRGHVPKSVRWQSVGELGKFLYPDLEFEKAISIISQINNDYDGEVTASQLAGIFGISSRGQGFQNRVEDLQLYGLVEGRGLYKLSELGKRIVDNVNDTEAKAEAFLKAPLFRAMHEEFKGKVPADMGVFISRLSKATKEPDEKKVSIRAARLRNHYNEALPYLAPEQFLGKEGELQRKTSDYAQRPTSPSLLTVPADYEKLVTGSFIVGVQRDPAAVELLDSQIKTWILWLRGQLGGKRAAVTSHEPSTPKEE
jgi:hypothetical protein